MSERDVLLQIKKNNPALWKRLVAPGGGLRGDNERAVLNAYQADKEQSRAKLPDAVGKILQAAVHPVDVKRIQRLTGKRVDMPGFVIDYSKTKEILAQHGLSDIDADDLIEQIYEQAQVQGQANTQAIVDKIANPEPEETEPTGAEQAQSLLDWAHDTQYHGG
jgi:hypothetical protein